MSVRLLDDASFELPLYRAAAHGDTQLCRRLLDEGADINERTQVGSATALMGAAKQGHEETCRLLINRGADIDAQDASGDTALHHAASRFHAEVCQELIEANANPNICNLEGQTAADRATTQMPFDIGIGPLREMIEASGRRQALLRLARARPEEDLASVEQVRARRGNDFMM